MTGKRSTINLGQHSILGERLLPERASTCSTAR